MYQGCNRRATFYLYARMLAACALALCVSPHVAYAKQALLIVEPEALSSQEMPAAATLEAQDDSLFVCDEAGSVSDELLYAQAEDAVTVRNLWLYDLDGTEQTLSGDYDCQKRFVIVGRPGCANTRNVLGQALGASTEDEFADINFLVLDVDGDRDTFQEGFGSYETDHVRFFSSDTDAYSSWAFWAYRAVGNEGSSVTLPFTVLIDKSNHIQAVFTGVQDVEGLCRTYLSSNESNPDDVDPGDPHQFDPEEPEEPEDPNAYDELSFSVWGTADMQSGRELLPLVNEARAAVGAKALTWDADLEKTAQLRGAEQMVLYSHTRPDGTTCFTAWPSRVASAAGENIAWGQTSVSEVNTGWTNSSGHYANMINSNFTTFAATHFVSEDGEDFWVECFGSGTGTGITGAPVMGSVKTHIDAIKGNTHLYLEASPGVYDSFIGEFDRRIPQLQVGQNQQLVLDAWHADIDPEDVIWSSNDPSIVRIGEDGVMVGVSAGTATVTAAPKTYPDYVVSADVTVSSETYEGLRGTWGTCPWEIDDEGTLLIYPGTGGDSLSDSMLYASCWIEYAGNIKSVRFVEQGGQKVVAPQGCHYLFAKLTKLVSADLTGLDTSHTTHLTSLFADCSSLQTVKIAGLDMSHVDDIGRMFFKCTSLKTLDLSGLDVSHVSQMYYLFQGCTRLEELNVSGWDTSQVTDMDAMFKDCVSLKTLDLSSWDTNSLEWDDTDTYTASPLFDGCSSLGSLRIGPGFVGSDERVFPEATASNGKWWSAATHEWLSKSDIVANRLGTGNLYTNYEDWDYVTPKYLSDATVSGVPNSVEYTGEAIEPVPVVTYDGETLVAGTDYTVRYANNLNVGTARVIITGQDAYAGAKSLTFTIAQKSLTSATVTGLTDKTYTYTGSAIVPDVTVTLGGKALVKDVDYVMGVSNNVNAGSARVTITGAGNYKGTKVMAFTIEKADLSDATVEGVTDATYTGSAITCNPTVKLNGRKLSLNTDYVLAYANNINVGTATLTVRGTGNYTGSVERRFTIAKAKQAVSAANVTLRLGEVAELGATTTGDGELTYESSDTRIVTVDSEGAITPVAKGTATVTVRVTETQNYEAATKKVTVTVKCARPTWSGASKIPVNATADIKVTNGGWIRLRDASGKNKTSDSYLALSSVSTSVKRITGKKAGSTTLYLLDADGEVAATKKVTVYSITSGSYEMQSCIADNLVLDIQRKSKDNSARMLVYTRNGGKNQQYQFKAQSDGSYEIVCVHSGKCVDVQGGGTKKSQAVIQYTWKGGANQKWKITVDASNYVTFVNVKSGMCFDIKGGKAKAGAYMIQYPSNGGKNQKWILNKK